MNWSSTDWLILRPLLVVAIVWATIVAALIAAWIRKLITARKRRNFADSALRQVAPPRTQRAR